ncbi:transposase [Mycobacterium sp.]|uniref:transposase n=1 Tax=Mycobacterium sp. TaxID=1785 RepID=UPI0025E9E659|nr:transposase [Mycobacterium sp.]
MARPGVGVSRGRRSFTPEYRVNAAHLVIDEHRRVAEVAGELGLHKNLLYTWVRDERWRMAEARAGQQTDSHGVQPCSALERAELVRLRATVAQQATKLAILENVSAYFATAVSKASRLELIAANCASHDLTRLAELLGVSPGYHKQLDAQSVNRRPPA